MYLGTPHVLRKEISHGNDAPMQSPENDGAVSTLRTAAWKTLIKLSRLPLSESKIPAPAAEGDTSRKGNLCTLMRAEGVSRASERSEVPPKQSKRTRDHEPDPAYVREVIRRYIRKGLLFQENVAGELRSWSPHYPCLASQMTQQQESDVVVVRLTSC